jgi:hypothetical protein
VYNGRRDPQNVSCGRCPTPKKKKKTKFLTCQIVKIRILLLLFCGGEKLKKPEWTLIIS